VSRTIDSLLAAASGCVQEETYSEHLEIRCKTGELKDSQMAFGPIETDEQSELA
jgi:hypothetical protein